MLRLSMLLAVLYGLALAPVQAQLGPGDTPVLVLTDGQSLAAPSGAGPFDNSAVLEAPSGTALSAEIAYQPYAPPASDVLWGLLISSQATPLPTTILPPPLFTQPPFLLVFPSVPVLDALGEGSLPLAVPAGLYDGTIYAQAILQDLSAPPGGALRLTNGVRVDVVPPQFNVRLSYVRATPALGVPDLSGVGHADLDSALMNELPPFGPAVPPVTADDPVGLPQGFEFLHILPNVGDAPVNPLARPLTRMTAPVTASQEDNVFEVEDTTGFPPTGKLLVSTSGNFPWNSKGGADKLPRAEVVTYVGKTDTSFFGLDRKFLGSVNDSNNPEHPHLAGDLVVGEFTMATTSGALTRDRVGLDARNPDMIHVVIPPFSFVPPAGPGGGEVTMDLDLYRYQDSDTGEQGFCVLDRFSQEWRVITGTLVDTSDGTRTWNPMVAIAPDGRSMLASVTVEDGEFFDSEPDELWAIRLDGLDWPATGSEAWQITYEGVADPVQTSTDVRARKIHMPGVSIVGTGPDDLVGFVAMAYKFRQSAKGTNTAPSNPLSGALLGYEGTWVREQNIIVDYFDVPLVAPGSGDALPTLPRPFLLDGFPLTGDGSSIIRFDPTPLRSGDGRALYLVGGADAGESNEELYRIANVAVSAAGEATYTIRNLTGHGSGGGADEVEIRAFDAGGHGFGQRGAVSPQDTRVAFLIEDNESRRDFIHIARTNGADFALVDHIYDDGDGDFREPGPYTIDHSVVGMRWIDEERLVFLMGRSFYVNPLGLDLDGDFVTLDPETQAALDVFIYNVTTDTMVNVTNTGGSSNGFGALGTIQPAAVFLSPNGQFYYVLRDGEPSQGNTVLEPGVEVMNILGVDLIGQTAFDVTGDELGTGALIPNLELPRFDGEAPIEPLAAMNFIEGRGVQEGMMFFTAHLAGDGSGSDTVVGFNANVPSLGLTVAAASGQGTHISNVTPSPDQALVAFARTADSNPLSVTQHAFVADLSAFGFVRDLTPQLVDANGDPQARFMDGSFQFVPAGSGVGTALCFVMGLDADPSSGVARQTAPAYYPLANVSNLLLEPEPVLLPLLTTNNLGPNCRIYLQAARLSTGEP